jgi:hypothetical protein
VINRGGRLRFEVDDHFEMCDLAPQPRAAIFLAVATPWVCLVIVLWASEHWIDAVVWLRRWRVAILGAGW